MSKIVTQVVINLYELLLLIVKVYIHTKTSVRVYKWTTLPE